MGPSGCGKSTVGRKAASLAHAGFVEADDHHTDEARARMARGEALSDDDRSPWIVRVARAANAVPKERVVLACSALSPRVRRELTAGLRFPVRFALLDVPAEELARRLSARAHHFVGPSLLASQLAALKAQDAVRVDGTLPPEEAAARVAALLSEEPRPQPPLT